MTRPLKITKDIHFRSMKRGRKVIQEGDPMQNPIHHAFITGRRIDGKTDWPFFRI